METSRCPTWLWDITVCEQQQGEGMDSRRISDENIIVGLDSAEERQPATRELFFPSATQDDNIYTRTIKKV